MKKTTRELYENARRRIRQKKILCYHFIVFLAGSLFLFTANELLETGNPVTWYPWAVTVWLFLLLLHFIKVYVTHRFMNKEWERSQIERLVARQKNRIAKLEQKMNPELCEK